MTLARLATVEPSQVVLSVMAGVPIFFDRFAGDALAVNEEPALGALKQDTIVAAAGDDQFNATGIAALDGEIVGRVLRVVDNRVAVDEFDRVLGVGSVDFD